MREFDPTLAARASAEGYTLRDVLKACRAYARINVSDGTYEPEPDHLSSAQMANNIYGYVEYHGVYVYAGKRWRILHGPRLSDFGEHRFSRPGESRDLARPKEELVELLGSLPVGSVILETYSLQQSRYERDYKKLPNGKFKCVRGRDDFYARGEEIFIHEGRDVAKFMGLPASRTFLEMFEEAYMVF